MNNLVRKQSMAEMMAVLNVKPRAEFHQGKYLSITYIPPVVIIDGEKVSGGSRVELVYESRLVLDKYPHPPYWNWVLIDRETYTLE